MCCATAGANAGVDASARLQNVVPVDERVPHGELCARGEAIADGVAQFGDGGDSSREFRPMLLGRVNTPSVGCEFPFSVAVPEPLMIDVSCMLPSDIRV